MAAYKERRDTTLRPLFEQTVEATAAIDQPQSELESLRVVFLSQHDGRKLVRALPGFLDQVFDPMDRLRHAVIAQLYEDAADKAPA